MKLKNVSQQEQKVCPTIGDNFACAPGDTTVELPELVAADLLTSFPSVWEPVGVHPKKSKKKES